MALPSILIPLVASGLGAILGRPRYRKQSYTPSPWSQDLWQQLQAQAGGRGVAADVERAAGQGIARAQGVGYRQALGQLGDDPALLANALAKIQAGSARASTESAARGAGLQLQARQAATGQMAGLAGQQQQYQQLAQQSNLAQRQQQDLYTQDVLGGLLQMLGEIMGAGQEAKGAERALAQQFGQK